MRSDSNAYPESHPPTFGSYEAWKLDNTLCTDRSSRYGAYGFKDNANDQSQSRRRDFISWESVNWGKLQQQCLGRNTNRYRNFAGQKRISTLHKEQDIDTSKNEPTREEGTKYHPRTAVILRTWIGKEYSQDEILNVRAMIMELSLLSGAEYEVILLVDAKDTDLPPPSDFKGMKALKKEHIPEELRDLAVFFNTKILEDWYPKIDDHG